VEFCPAQVLAMAERLSGRGVTPAEVRVPDACIGCRDCATVCPEGCVEVYVKTGDEPS
jgi:2-oxoglutarate ferredoxin oxidoreductase subunit delta